MFRSFGFNGKAVSESKESGAVCDAKTVYASYVIETVKGF